MPGLGRLAPLLAVAALFLIPWAFWLARTLPATHTARHWALGWAGYDGGLALAFASTAISAIRHSPWLVAAASATGTLLVVDAWFDVLTAHAGGELAIAAVEAALVELPLAGLSFWIVRDSERAIQSLCDCLPHRQAHRDETGPSVCAQPCQDESQSERRQCGRGHERIPKRRGRI
jgi:hypothetical protein